MTNRWLRPIIGIPFRLPVKIPISVTSTSIESPRGKFWFAPTWKDEVSSPTCRLPRSLEKDEKHISSWWCHPPDFWTLWFGFIPASCKPISSQFINHTSFTHFHHLGGIKIEPSWFIGFTSILYPIILYPIIFPLQFSFITPFWKLVFYFQYSHSFILLLILLFFLSMLMKTGGYAYVSLPRSKKTKRQNRSSWETVARRPCQGRRWAIIIIIITYRLVVAACIEATNAVTNTRGLHWGFHQTWGLKQ